MEKHHFEQAKIWLAVAEHTGNLEKENSDIYAVAVAMVIPMIIKANDALTYKFLNATAKRHDDARHLFEGIVG